MPLIPPPEPEKPFRWLFLDLNAYFASCEQQADPSLRGRPIAVTPTMVDSGCCIAASYPAKKFGVKPAGWEKHAANWHTVADVDSDETMAEVRVVKREMKAKGKQP